MEDSTRIIEERDIPKVDCLVAGFPGNGLIGGIASEQMISTLGLEQVASLDCDDFPPTAVIFDGVPRRPVRFFAGKGFMLVKSDMVIPPESASKIAKAVISWVKDLGVTEVIVFDGIPQREGSDESKVWGVLSTHEAEDLAEQLEIDLIHRGAISGISSSLLLNASENKLDAVGLLVEGNTNMPDPRAAAKILEIFARYKDFDISTDELIKSAEQLEQELSQLVNQTKKAQEEMEERTAHPPLYG